jgi:hypothetical protein
LILFGIVALWASTSRTAMQYISEKRNVDTWWGSYQCLNGDLVSMSYLDAVKKFNQPNPRTGFKQPVYNGVRNTALYLVGDSHTWHVKDSNFVRLSSFYYFERIHGGYYHLDTTKRNILLIEISERYLQSYFSSLQMFDEVYDSSTRKKNLSQESLPRENHAQFASVFPSFEATDLFNKYINQNLQCNLFNYNFMMPMFEYKAALNYYVFNRASGDVVISNDRQFLFYKETVSKTDEGSSYYPVSKESESQIVDVLNKVYDHYKAEGFSEVYVSIIPNSATIMQPDGYNNLIPDVQNDARLKMKVIDIYTVFKKSDQLNFLPGDTHWNHSGKQLWLDVVNERLRKQ